MTTDNTYNGWRNYETWAVSLWIDNDEGSYNFWRDRAKQIEDTLGKTQSKYALAEELKENFKDGACDILDASNATTQSFQDCRWPVTFRNETHCSASLWADLLHAALSEVDWNEIAENLMTE